MSTPFQVTGKRQSPIDIQSECVSNERTKRSIGESIPLQIDYSPLIGVAFTIENTGHGWKLNVPDEEARKCQITGGPLNNQQYRLLQIHAHWGKDTETGSEHTVNGKTYPAEIHLVHWNCSKYSSPSEATVCSDDGLAVIGTFLEISNQEPNQILSIIGEACQSIAFKNEKITIQNNGLNINQLIPNRECPKFWHYLGSLTTPPYSESVLWIVMTEPIQAQENQISIFRSLYKNEESEINAKKVVENFREVQSLNNRPVLYFN